MLLRSSSTPVLGSLLPSFSSDSPNNSHYFDTNSIPKHYAFHLQTFNNKSPSLHQTGCVHISCNSSPISPSMSESNLRRAQSDGNLEGLAYYTSCSSNNNDGYSQLKKFPARQKFLMLETIPSFSQSNSRGRNEEEEEDDDGDWDDNEEEEQKDGSFGLNNKMEGMGLGEKIGVMGRNFNLGYFEEKKTVLVSEEMYLARGLGLGIDGGSNNGGGGGGGSGGPDGAAGDGGDMNATELYYKKMVQENPSNPLLLRNYAQFLYKAKKDLKGAEEYFSRAILADPKDGEILSQYAKIVWELHDDEDRASTYFERAVQASPQDSHVHAAYASFLWETEEAEGDDCSVPKEFETITSHFNGVVA